MVTERWYAIPRTVCRAQELPNASAVNFRGLRIAPDTCSCSRMAYSMIVKSLVKVTKMVTNSAYSNTIVGQESCPSLFRLVVSLEGRGTGGGIAHRGPYSSDNLVALHIELVLVHIFGHLFGRTVRILHTFV